MAKSALSRPKGAIAATERAIKGMEAKLGELPGDGKPKTRAIKAEINELKAEHNLTDKQAAFVEVIAMGVSPEPAVKAAYGPGFEHSDARKYMAIPKISQAIINARGKNAYMLGLTRDKVLQGFIDAIDHAKMLADPMAQIAGWREVAKVCGFYAPEVKKIELSGTAKRIADRMAAMTDDELLAIQQAEDIPFVEVAGE